jgi:hypothetical protein
LAITTDLSIVGERGQNLFMPEVLTPCFELFRRLADFLAKSGKSISEAVRIEVRQARFLEGFTEDASYGRGAAPAGCI